MDLRARMHPDDEPRVVQGTYKALDSHTVADMEFRVIRPDGSLRIVQDRVQGLYDENGKPLGMIGTVQDVTEQRQAEKELAELRNHLQTNVELERLRLAQELHDGPMQDLYGSSYRLEELVGAADPELQSQLQQINDEIQQTISGLRAIAKELRPPAISNFGLEKAIRSYVEDFREKYPNVKLLLSLAQDRQMLPETMRLTLFRVFQQALANVVRHSKASEVRVRFSLDAEEARLEITDNGLGFAVPPNWMGFVRHGHYGLAGAAERVHALGGLLLVDSAPQRSTTVTAVIPWTPGPEPSADGRETAGTPMPG
jgi:signal transduction histidine kinase